jgi:hypothetical protein
VVLAFRSHQLTSLSETWIVRGSEEMNIEELIRTLDDLRSQYSILSKSPIRGEDVERLNSLMTEVLTVERRLAAARNEPYAIPWEWPVDWAFSVFQPIVVSSGRRTLLMYAAQEKESSSKAKKGQTQYTAILTFRGCANCKFGDPNDEVIEGHPLYGRGIDVGEAYIVMNSPWLEELKKINSVHPQFDDESWAGKRHYLLFFKDNTFECIAEDVTSQVKERPLPEVVSAEVDMLLRR